MADTPFALAYGTQPDIDIAVSNHISVLPNPFLTLALGPTFHGDAETHRQARQ